MPNTPYLHRHHVLWSLVGALVLFNVTLWSSIYEKSPTATGVLTFAMLNVGQGDSLFIEGPTGRQVLVDGGPNPSVLTELPKVMPFFDRSIDVVIETHPDADHIGGLVSVLTHYVVGAFIEPGIEKSNVTNNSVESHVTSEHVSHYVARRGMWLDLGGGAHLDILYPDWDVTHMDVKEDNDGGIVAHLVYGSTSVLLTADTSTAVEDHLMMISTTTDLQSTILKVAHHGSRFSNEDAFVSEVNPQIALISVGAHNTYGHPTPQTLATLAKHNIEVHRTDQEGTIVYKSDGKTFTRVP